MKGASSFRGEKREVKMRTTYGKSGKLIIYMRIFHDYKGNSIIILIIGTGLCITSHGFSFQEPLIYISAMVQVSMLVEEVNGDPV